MNAYFSNKEVQDVIEFLKVFFFFFLLDSKFIIRHWLHLNATAGSMFKDSVLHSQVKKNLQ